MSVMNLKNYGVLQDIHVFHKFESSIDKVASPMNSVAVINYIQAISKQ